MGTQPTMTRFRQESPTRPSFSGASSPPWACQLISFHIDRAGVVLDLVALEPRPGSALDWPRFTPFTVHMALAAVSAEAVEPVLTAWTESADEVEITARESPHGRWLCFSALGTELVAKLVAPRRRTLR